MAIELTVTDANGNPVNGDLFHLDRPHSAAALTRRRWHGHAGRTVAPGTVAFTFIPTDSAATNGADPLPHRRHARYVDPDLGGEVTTPLFPSTITVYPQASSSSIISCNRP